MIKQSKAGKPRSGRQLKVPHTYIYADKDSLPESIEYTNLFQRFQNVYYRGARHEEHPENHIQFRYGAVFIKPPGRVELKDRTVWFKWRPYPLHPYDYWVCVNNCKDYDFESWIRAIAPGNPAMVMKNYYAARHELDHLLEQHRFT